MEAAARRWQRTWQEAWPRADSDAIAKLYAPDAVYRALAFRDADRGSDQVRAYLERTFRAESDVVCHFGQPLVSGDQAAVEWWASWNENGSRLTMAGTTVLRFDGDGLVVDHRDYWNQQPGRAEPYDGWVRH